MLKGSSVYMLVPTEYMLHGDCIQHNEDGSGYKYLHVYPTSLLVVMLLIWHSSTSTVDEV